MAVNISAHQLMSVGFADTVASVLDTTPTDPGLLTLEVTESIFVRDGERALIVLEELKALGLKLALDDFGTGYSSLSRLQTLPIDIIKVDRSFVTHVEGDPAGRTILTSIIELAHGLGMTVICEGVETAEQQRELSKLAADCCQGFYFAHPMPRVSIDGLIHHRGNGSNPLLP